MFDKRERSFKPLRRLRLVAPEADPTQRSETTLPNAYPSGKRFEIPVVTYENCAKSFANRGNQQIWRIRRDALAQENYVVASVP